MHTYVLAGGLTAMPPLRSLESRVDAEHSRASLGHLQPSRLCIQTHSVMTWCSEQGRMASAHCCKFPAHVMPLGWCFRNLRILHCGTTETSPWEWSPLHHLRRRGADDSATRMGCAMCRIHRLHTRRSGSKAVLPRLHRRRRAAEGYPHAYAAYEYGTFRR